MRYSDGMRQMVDKLTADTFVHMFERFDDFEARIKALEEWKEDHSRPSASEEAAL